MITCVISLPEAKIRRKMISEQLRVAGLPFRIIDGVVGEILAKSAIYETAPQLFMARFGRNLGAGEIGCTLSHKLALETFLATSQTIALILEDDAVVPADITFWSGSHERYTTKIVMVTGLSWIDARRPH